MLLKLDDFEPAARRRLRPVWRDLVAPFGIALMRGAALSARDGDIALARAAGDAGFSAPLRITRWLLRDFAIKLRWVLCTFVTTLRNGMPHFENSRATRDAPIITKQAARDFGRKDHLNRTTSRSCAIFAPAKVAQARAVGCDGVILSNHGGRQPASHAPEILRTEVHRNLGLLGLRDLTEISREILYEV